MVMIVNSKYNIERFIDAQNEFYEIALKEIKNGKKETHWMWFIFPQLKYLGDSEMSLYYGISNKEEAILYLKNVILRNRLINISNELYKLNDNINNIMGPIDSLKLNSSMTLFKYIEPDIEIFSNIIEKFYDGEEDQKTLRMLKVR